MALGWPRPKAVSRPAWKPANFMPTMPSPMPLPIAAKADGFGSPMTTGLGSPGASLGRISNAFQKQREAISGIGAKFRKGEQGFFRVHELTPGDVAEASGKLEIDDMILQVNGRSMLNVRYQDFMDEVFGRPGSEVEFMACHSRPGSVPRRVRLKRAGADPVEEPAAKKQRTGPLEVTTPTEYSEKELRHVLKMIGTADGLSSEKSVPDTAKLLPAGFLPKLGFSVVFGQFLQVFLLAKVGHRKALTYVVHAFLDRIKGSAAVPGPTKAEWSKSCLEAFLLKIGKQVRAMPHEERSSYCKLVRCWGENQLLAPDDVKRLKEAWDIID